MDWDSRRLTAIIENALLEDRATRDATSYACIDPSQRATGTVIAKQDCILSGVGSIARILDVYRSEEHTSELQSRRDLVCRLLLEKKKKKNMTRSICSTLTM